MNLQRGFVTVQAGGRLQVRVDAPPAALQPTEWQSIPRALQQDLPAASANFAFRLVEPAFQLPLQLERHEAAKLLPARVNNITFTSVISDDGVMLTQVRLEMVPGDKRLLHLTLPARTPASGSPSSTRTASGPGASRTSILIPLEQQSRGGKAIPVEIFYSSPRRPGRATRALDLELLAPKFDLPLENITWRVYLSDKWRLKDWTGSLQLQQEQVVAARRRRRPANLPRRRGQPATREDQGGRAMLAPANSALEQGDPAAGPARLPGRLRPLRRTTTPSTRTPACSCTTSSSSRRSSA